jgi:ABC-type polysaccharide/polyol phosphate export permease
MFRWSLAGAAWPGNGALLSLGVSAVVLAGGVAFFQRRQRAFADVI